jgi:cold-inducible RNA-binding protein
LSKKLYVGNLSFQTTEDELRQTFGQYGTVNTAQMVMDRETGRSRGFAFVEMADGAEAEAAIQALNGSQLDGRSLTVNEAKPREERPRSASGSRGGYGGGGGGRY